MRILMTTLLLAASAPAGMAHASPAERVAAVLVGEAASEGSRGLAAVACVLQNRARERGTSVETEAYRPRQFSSVGGRLWARAQYDPTWAEALALARRAIAFQVEDITGGALYYHSGRAPNWSRRLRFTCRIGRHQFYR